jgi:capsule polysaccharide export protein KpsE/RkpR
MHAPFIIIMITFILWFGQYYITQVSMVGKFKKSQSRTKVLILKSGKGTFTSGGNIVLTVVTKTFVFR